LAGMLTFKERKRREKSVGPARNATSRVPRWGRLGAIRVQMYRRRGSQKKKSRAATPVQGTAQRRKTKKMRKRGARYSWAWERRGGKK